MGTTESDPLSIMCYHLPGSIMKDRKSVRGGLDINPRDAAFASSLYPNPERARVETPERVPPLISVRPAPADEGETFHLIVMDDFRRSANGSRTKDAKSPASAQVLATYGGARVTSVMRLRASKGEAPTAFGRIIATHTNIKKYTNGIGGSLPAEGDLLRFGGELFDTLFQGDVRRLYDEARTALTDRIFTADAQGDLIADTPAARLMVRGWAALSEELVMAWAADPAGVTRDQLLGAVAGSLPALVDLVSPPTRARAGAS
jgi:hypothetical protein